ncbi:TetR/AcrR family transcriptional regulator [Nakamurella sp. GG22]
MISTKTAVTSTPGEVPSAPHTSAARARILAAATRLFYSTGIRAVGVDRIIAESDVARMTFFRHFPTKDHLVTAFLESQAEAGRTELRRAREASENGPRAVLAAVAAGAMTEPATDGFRGCEFINTAAEFCDPGHPARLVVDRHRAWIRDLMTDALAELGHPDPRSTAQLLLMLRTGAIVAASLEGFTDDDGAFEKTWWSLVDRTG